MRVIESFNKLKKCRIRLQRARDGKILNGRLENLTLVDAVLHIEDGDNLRPGDEISLEIHGPMLKVLVRGKIIMHAGKKASMEVLGEMRYLQTTESARINVESVMAKVHYDDMTLIASVFDISREGISIRLMDAVSPGQQVKIDIQTNGRTIQVCGVARYCRELNDGMGHTRIGIQLHHQTRLGTAKWFAYFDQFQEAA